MPEQAAGSSDQEPRWFVRIDNIRQGPHSSAKVRRLLLDGEVSLTDEISGDGRTWRKVNEVSQVVPRSLRAKMGDQSEHARRASNPLGTTGHGEKFPYTSMFTSLLLLLAVVGIVVWLDRPGQTDHPDCNAPAGPGVDWRNCVMADLDVGSASLAGADLNSAVLRRASLTATDLSGSDLRYADLDGADLSYAQLQHANLQGANLRQTNLNSATLSDADLRYADLSGSRLNGANLSGVLLGGAIWIDGKTCAEASIGRCLFNR